jgi:membrane protease YdiL (CAAX protease family)
VLNGSWENNHRNITAAAITGLLIVGVIYFNVQSLLVFAFIFIFSSVSGTHISTDTFGDSEALGSEYKIPVLIALLLSQYIFMLTPAVIIIRKWHTKNVVKYLRIRLSSVSEILLAVLITLSLLPFCYFISELLLDILGVPDSLRDISEHLFAAKSTGQFLFLVLVVAITPAICEETFFRGYFQRTLERTTGMKSFIWTGILFGLFHMQPLGLITLSLLGLLFSFFFYRSKSIFPSSAAHFTNNFIALLLMYAPKKFGFILNGKISFLFVASSMGAAAVLFLLYLKISGKQKTDNAVAFNN